MSEFIIDMVRACAWPSAFVIVAVFALLTLRSADRKVSTILREAFIRKMDGQKQKADAASADWWNQA
jgi:hypothetical protein